MQPNEGRNSHGGSFGNLLLNHVIRERIRRFGEQAKQRAEEAQSRAREVGDDVSPSPPRMRKE